MDIVDDHAALPLFRFMVPASQHCLSRHDPRADASLCRITEGKGTDLTGCIQCFV